MSSIGDAKEETPPVGGVSSFVCLFSSGGFGARPVRRCLVAEEKVQVRPIGVVSDPPGFLDDPFVRVFEPSPVALVREAVFDDDPVYLKAEFGYGAGDFRG